MTALPIARHRFVERLGTSLEEARREGHRVALFLVGVDRSSGCIASLEPDAAESLVRRICERLARCAGDRGEPALLRPGEFAVVVPRFRNGAQLREAAARMLATVRFSYRASIGIAIFPADGTRPGALLGCAAIALAAARREGRHSYSFYLPFLAATSAASSPPDL